MSDRKYSVNEIDALRTAVENKYLFGSYSPTFRSAGFSRSYREADKAIVVEQQVRTHMLAGHTAEDLIGRPVNTVTDKTDTAFDSIQEK